jgi:hypothetical protein
MNLQEAALRTFELLAEHKELRQRADDLAALLNAYFDAAAIKLEEEGVMTALDLTAAHIPLVVAALPDGLDVLQWWAESLMVARRLAAVEVELRGLMLGDGGMNTPYMLAVGFGDSSYGELMKRFVANDLEA